MKDLSHKLLQVVNSMLIRTGFETRDKSKARRDRTFDLLEERRDIHRRRNWDNIDGNNINEEDENSLDEKNPYEDLPITSQY